MRLLFTVGFQRFETKIEKKNESPFLKKKNIYHFEIFKLQEKRQDSACHAQATISDANAHEEDAAHPQVRAALHPFCKDLPLIIHLIPRQIRTRNNIFKTTMELNVRQINVLIPSITFSYRNMLDQHWLLLDLQNCRFVAAAHIYVMDQIGQ